MAVLPANGSSSTTRWTIRFSGTIQGNPSVAGARLGLVKRGAGTLHLTGSSNTYADNFAIENGTVRITGINNVGGTGLGQANIGNVANQSGVLFVDGGTLNASKTNAPSLSIGTVANSRGVLRMDSGCAQQRE
jgi:autotransporter-associated beta strand protein